MSERTNLLPGTAVLVAHTHPRTKARGMFPGTVRYRLVSGRYVVLLSVEGVTYRVVTDSANVRAS